jgi:hypothetical protein
MSNGLANKHNPKHGPYTASPRLSKQTTVSSKWAFSDGSVKLLERGFFKLLKSAHLQLTGVTKMLYISLYGLWCHV